MLGVLAKPQYYFSVFTVTVESSTEHPTRWHYSQEDYYIGERGTSVFGSFTSPTNFYGEYVDSN
jgi:hypothetical protein